MRVVFRSLLAVAAGTFVSLLASRADAIPTARLVYSRSEGAESCPDEMALREAVAQRIGHDPFVPWAQRTVVASISRSEQSFVGSVDLIDENGMSHGARRLHTTGACGELLDVVALAIAISIDPQTLVPSSAPPPPPPSPPPPAPADPVPAFLPPPAAPLAAAETPSLPARAVARSEVEAGVVTSTGFSPSVAVGLMLGAALRWPQVSVGFEGRVDAPSSHDLGGGHVSSWLVAGSLVPCVHLGAFMACGIAQAGSIQASGGGLPARSGQAWWLGAGARLGALAWLLPNVGLRVHGDVLADLAPVTWELGGQKLVTPNVAGVIGLEAVVRF